MGTYGWLSYEKYQTRKSVKRKLKKTLCKSDLTHLCFSVEEARELRWEHSKEFEYKGEMYDVVYVEEAEGNISYWCWLDKDETSLNNMLADMTESLLGEDDDRQQQKQNLLNFIKSLYTAEHPIQAKSFLLVLQRYHFSFCINTKRFVYRAVPNPPPQV